MPSHLRVKPSRDAEIYEYRTGKVISAEPVDTGVVPSYEYDIAEANLLIDKLADSRRDNTVDELHFDRLALELDFFQRSNGFSFLLQLQSLIERFKQNNVVWGCGRGSSCASYTLFLMEVHDINPIRYKIDFSEFSKEDYND